MRDIYIPDAGAMMGAFAAGQRQLEHRRAQDDERRQLEARKGIGAAMATGDYAGASRLAYDTGDLSVGLQLQQRGDDARKATTKREIITKGRSDPKAAQEQALAEGEFDLYEDLKGLTDAAEKQRYASFAVVLRSIAQHEPDLWDDKIAENRGALEAAGVPPAEIDAFIQANPDRRTGMMALMLQRADQFEKFQEERDKDRTFKATEADRAADNKRAEAQLALSRQSVGISAGNLAQRRAEHQERKAQGGYSPGPAAGPGKWEEF